MLLLTLLSVCQICSPALQPILQNETRGGCTELTRIIAANPSFSPSSPALPPLQPALCASYSNSLVPSRGVGKSQTESLSCSVPTGPPSTVLISRDWMDHNLIHHLQSHLQLTRRYPKFIVWVCVKDWLEACYNVKLTWQDLLWLSDILISIRILTWYQHIYL